MTYSFCKKWGLCGAFWCALPKHLIQHSSKLTWLSCCEIPWYHLMTLFKRGFLSLGIMSQNDTVREHVCSCCWGPPLTFFPGVNKLHYKLNVLLKYNFHYILSLGVIGRCRKLIRHCFVIFPLNGILERLIFSHARLIAQDKNVIFNIKKWGILRSSCWWFSCSSKSISEINLIAVICLKRLICWWVVFFTCSLVDLKECIHVKY